MPSIVVISPPTSPTRSEQDRTATPSTCTVQAPHTAIPQPYFGPVNPSSSRSTQSSGMSSSTFTSNVFWLTFRRMGPPAPLFARSPPRSAPSWRVVFFVGEAIHHLLGGKSGDGKAADRLQAVVAAVIDEILRSEDGSAQAAGKFLKPRRQVYRRADASEIQPVAAADIAELHVADMQRQTKAQAAAIAIARTQRGNLRARCSAGFQCGGADRREIALGADLKDRQQSVAHIFEHFATVFDDRRHLAVEIAIEQIDQILRRQRVGQRGETAHVGQPDRGADRLSIAAANMSRQHAFAGILA